MWDGVLVTQWNPEAGQISLPAKRVTYCVFGGDDLNDLYIISAHVDLDEADLPAYRPSGSLMRAQTRVRGMPAFEFG